MDSPSKSDVEVADLGNVQTMHIEIEARRWLPIARRLYELGLEHGCEVRSCVKKRWLNQNVRAYVIGDIDSLRSYTVGLQHIFEAD